MAKPVLAALALASAGLLAGCSAGDVQLNGKIFDVVGLNTDSKPKVAKMSERTPLVMPPGVQQLPAPGSGATETAALAEIKDPDAAKTQSKEELARQQAEYCKTHYEIPKMRGEDVDHVKGPAGDCRPSILSSAKSIWGDGSEEE